MRHPKPNKRVIISFVVDTNAEQGELDDFLSHASEELFPDYRDEDTTSDSYTMLYQPEGSHWREMQPPYPWCHGNPTRLDCIKAGYCKRNPNCGD